MTALACTDCGKALALNPRACVVVTLLEEAG